jgi:hypothetical protein
VRRLLLLCLTLLAACASNAEKLVRLQRNEYRAMKDLRVWEQRYESATRNSSDPRVIKAVSESLSVAQGRLSTTKREIDRLLR